MLVRVARNGGTEFELFEPAFFLGDYEPRVSLEVSVNQQKAEMAQEALQMYQLLAPIATNPQKLNEILLPKVGDILTPEEVKQIFSQPEGSQLQEQPQGLEAALGLQEQPL